jgi:hypothetical protein
LVCEVICLSQRFTVLVSMVIKALCQTLNEVMSKLYQILLDK